MLSNVLTKTQISKQVKEIETVKDLIEGQDLDLEVFAALPPGTCVIKYQQNLHCFVQRLDHHNTPICSHVYIICICIPELWFLVPLNLTEIKSEVLANLRHQKRLQRLQSLKKNGNPSIPSSSTVCSSVQHRPTHRPDDEEEEDIHRTVPSIRRQKRSKPSFLGEEVSCNSYSSPDVPNWTSSDRCMLLLSTT